jgi:hypothetical protein
MTIQIDVIREVQAILEDIEAACDRYVLALATEGRRLEVKVLWRCRPLRHSSFVHNG